MKEATTKVEVAEVSVQHIHLHSESDYTYKCQGDGKIFDSHMCRIFNMRIHNSKSTSSSSS